MTHFNDAICAADLYDGGVDYEPEPDDPPTGSEDEEDDVFSEVTHQECGGTVVFENRQLEGEDAASPVLVCKRCSMVITDTDDLHPQGAVCGVDLRDIQSQRSAA